MIRNRTFLLQWVLAVIISAVLWVVSVNQNRFEVKYDLLLTPPSVSADYIVLSDHSHDSVRITFTGRGIGVLRDQITRNPESIQISIAMNDQNQLFPLRIEKEITGSDIEYSGNMFSSLEPIAFNPDRIEFTIDRNTVRNLPVGITSSSQIPERYYWQEVSHSTVEIKGAESVVIQMESCYTVPVAPGSEEHSVAIVKPEGVVYIIPSSVSAELVPPVQVICKLE